MSDEKDEKPFGNINIVEENGKTLYKADNGAEFTVVDDLCIDGFYYNEHLKGAVRLLHVKEEEKDVFFWYTLAYGKGGVWKCSEDVFKRAFTTKPFENIVKGSVSGCVHVTVDTDYNILKRFLDLPLEISSRTGFWPVKTKRQIIQDKINASKHKKKTPKNEKTGNRKERQYRNKQNKLKNKK